MNVLSENIYCNKFIFNPLSFFLSFQNEKNIISRMNTSTISGGIYKIAPQIIDFKDTIPNDTLII
ncbi:MAG: hypothetical protein KAH68_05355 [Draconibacterium sp.]|nr:hypothetical protein [Draconibacterium sp.]